LINYDIFGTTIGWYPLKHLMKNLSLTLFAFIISHLCFAQSIKDANIYPSNIESNMWFESYDAQTMTIKNLNFMVLADGNNSKDRTGAFVVKLYMYNKEKYEAEKTVIYVQTYELDGIYHMGSHEWKNKNISIKGFGLTPGVWRLGIMVDADDQIKENDSDNALLFQGEIIIKDGQENGTAENKTEEKTNTGENTNTNAQTIDPDQALKDEKVKTEAELTGFTKQIATKEFELNENKKKGITAYDQKIAELEIQELKLRKDEKALALTRLDQTISKKASVDQQQNSIAKEQELQLKANTIQKERNEMLKIKTQNSAYEHTVKDCGNKIATAESQLAALPRATKLDSINYDIRKYEIDELKYKQHAAVAGKDRTDKIINGTITEEEKKRYISIEEDFNYRAEEANKKVSKLMQERKTEEKVMRKSDNKDKVDNTKIKAKIKIVNSDIKSKEKALAKEKGKSKPSPEKIAQLEKELADLKVKLKDLESQIK
jgi:hypothetical protein